MMRTTSRPVAFVLPVVLFVFAAAPDSRGAIPGADNSNAFTELDLRKARLAFNKRTLTDAYNAGGKKDPKWDAAAVAFLDAMALGFSNAGADEWYRLPGEKPFNELLALAQAALEAGCDDPLVVYCHAAIRDNLKSSPKELGPIVQAAAEQLMKGKYPVFRALAAHQRMYRLTDAGHEQRRAEIMNTCHDLAAALVLHTEYRDLDRRFILEFIWDDMSNNVEQQKQFVARLAGNDKIDPWMYGIIMGRHEIKLAWQARGSGWASTVTEDGWAKFYEHLARAKRHLAAAHEARPNYPEAATDMITVAMGGQIEGDEGTRYWFDKAAQAQLDYYPAYHSYLWSIRPRWGGSHGQMYAFGVECLQTKRFDTRVPWELFNVLTTIGEDAGDQGFYKRPGVYENVKTLFDGLIANAEPPHDVNLYRSYHAAMAWRCGRYDEACRLIDELGPKLDPRAYLRVDAMPRLAASHAYAMRDGLSDTITTAEQQASTRNLPAAAAAYEKAIATLKPDDKAGYFLRSRLKQLQWQQQFEKGAPVDIMPDKDFIGWQPMYGNWEVDDKGGVVGTYDARGLWMPCQASFLGNAFVIEGDVELLGDVRAEGGVGFATQHDFSIFWGLYVLRRADGCGILNRGFQPHMRDEVELQPVNHFKLTVQRDSLSGTLNGQEIFRNYAVTHPFGNHRPYAGLGGRAADPGAQVRFSNLRVTRLGGGGAGAQGL